MHGFAYSRSLICNVTADSDASSIGINAMCIQIDEFMFTQTNFWQWLHDTLVKYNVRVLMGQFNSQLNCVIDNLRSRGLTAHLAESFWGDAFGWRHRTNSCGVFYIDFPSQPCGWEGK